MPKRNTVDLPFSVVDELDLPWDVRHREHVETDDHGDATYAIVFEYNEKLYQTLLTQTRRDGIYWGNDERRPEFIECVEVRPIEKTIIVYEPVDDTKGAN